MYNRPYVFLFSDTASPTNYTLLRPSVIVLCYSISDPASLSSIQKYWKGVVETHFNYDESLPVILLGLGRDARQKEDYDGKVRPMAGTGEDDGEVLVGRRIVYPQEALRVAQEMRLDLYCECSALTGEVSDPISTSIGSIGVKEC
jgi:Ras homolog gene family, member A